VTLRRHLLFRLSPVTSSMLACLLPPSLPRSFIPASIIPASLMLVPQCQHDYACPNLALHHTATPIKSPGSSPLDPYLPTTRCLHPPSFASALDIMARRRPHQHSPCTRFHGGDGCRCLPRRDRRKRASGDYAHGWRGCCSSCIGFIGSRARRWIRSHSPCVCFFGGRARRWICRRSSCTILWRPCLQMDPQYFFQGSFSGRRCLSRVSLISRRPALAVFLLSFTLSYTQHISHGGDGDSSRRREAAGSKTDRHELEVMLVVGQRWDDALSFCLCRLTAHGSHGRSGSPRLPRS
jgi:hypothetical protein